MKIIPAVLAENYDDFLLRMRQAELFTDYVQIDVMDGIFVPTKSFSLARLSSLKTSLSFELHLMVQHPFSCMAGIEHEGLKKVIFHFESDVEHFQFISKMKDSGYDVGLAVNPDTKFERFRHIAEQVKTILFLTVDPGRYGSPFRPEVLKKIVKSRKIFGDKIISTDGGVSTENLELLLNAGVDYACVGSRIFLEGDPSGNYNTFIRRLEEIEKRNDYRDRI
jgi:ribulose-phosphate 3-epimerase